MNPCPEPDLLAGLGGSQVSNGTELLARHLRRLDEGQVTVPPLLPLWSAAQNTRERFDAREISKEQKKIRKKKRAKKTPVSLGKGVGSYYTNI